MIRVQTLHTLLKLSKDIFGRTPFLFSMIHTIKSSIHVQFFEISQVNFKFIILGKYIDGNVVEIS